LVAAVKIHSEFPAADAWQVEGKQCIVVHGGCGAPPVVPSGRRFAYVNRGFHIAAVTKSSVLAHNPDYMDAPKLGQPLSPF
jgi:hypothetical protein